MGYLKGIKEWNHFGDGLSIFITDSTEIAKEYRGHDFFTMIAVLFW